MWLSPCTTPRLTSPWADELGIGDELLARIPARVARHVTTSRPTR